MSGLSSVARLLLRLFGWRTLGSMPPELKQSVIIAAPHTSNWDVPLFVLAAFALKVPITFFAKQSAFFWPLGPLLRIVGAVPLDRGRSRGAVKAAVRAFGQHETLHFALAPEGTRKWVPGWKRGFYRIARSAGVPVVPAFVDFDRREIGIAEPVYLTGNEAADLEKIAAAYAGRRGRFPDKAAPIRFRAEKREPGTELDDKSV